MKKIFYFFFCILILSDYSFSQNASTYFPSSPGYHWYFKNTPLDSLNNPQPSLATFEVDSFATVRNYQGLQASLVLSKSGLTSVSQNAPFLDSSYYNFQGTNAWYYLDVLSLIDTIPYFEFLRSLEAWYDVYRFAQTVNTNYTIFSRDTTITFDTLTLPLRISATGRRLNDQSVSTVNGTYLAKKFLLTFSLSYLIVLPPPFPPIEVPIVVRPDTTYIASGIWRIKEVIPSINVDLTSLGFPFTFSVPGVLTELTQGPVGIFNQSNLVADDFKLFQNYPNPFNPVTKIKFDIPQDARREMRDVRLVVYNVGGKEITTLVNEKLSVGSYEVEFDASGFSSGIYFYELETENFSNVKRMILLK